MIKKNWAYTHNFRDIVELIGVCGGKEISSHLLTAPRNATYLSPVYVAKMVSVMADYIKTPILCTFVYSDETADITSIEQLAIYAAFDYDNVVSEHFIGLIPISKEVGTHLSAANIIKVLERFFLNMDIPIKNARFSCMDTTNVNSGKRSGLKRLLEHAIPLLKWIGCNNHKLALCFKHLIPQFNSYFRC